jgi:hypothetical protein
MAGSAIINDDQEEKEKEQERNRQQQQQSGNQAGQNQAQQQGQQPGDGEQDDGQGAGQQQGQSSGDEQEGDEDGGQGGQQQGQSANSSQSGGAGQSDSSKEEDGDASGMSGRGAGGSGSDDGMAEALNQLLSMSDQDVQEDLGEMLQNALNAAAGNEGYGGECIPMPNVHKANLGSVPVDMAQLRASVNATRTRPLQWMSSVADGDISHSRSGMQIDSSRIWQGRLGGNIFIREDEGIDVTQQSKLIDRSVHAALDWQVQARRYHVGPSMCRD